MKKLLLFVLAVMGFAACTQDVEVSVIERHDTPETITVGFEGDDTRIQLNEAQKTVWNKGDLASVFYRSDANQKWQYQGETGERVGDLKRVESAVGTTKTTKTIVVYPYSENYWLNTDSYAIEATLPAIQCYTAGSYGVGDNLMVAQSEFTQFSLKSVCGWLKLQLTGDGEVVKSITFKGKDGEQVAGLIYVDTATAEATLASEMGSSDDNNAGGNLIFDDTILTEVTLDCGEGVALSKKATSFYIALPPQIFEKGLTVEIEDVEGYVMEQSTEKVVNIERNTIQPMSAFEFVNPNTPSTPKPANNEIWYTANAKVEPYFDDALTFGADVVSNVWDSKTKKGVITFDGDVTMIGDDAFNNSDKLTGVTLPDSVTSIGKKAFYDCEGLIEFTIPDSVTSIGNYAFDSCSSLKSVTIPDSVTTIGDSAFLGCSSLAEFKGKFAEDNGRILVVDGILIASAPAGLTEYTIPDSVTSIGEYAFHYCNSLTSVIISDSVITIGDYAFYSCTSLTSVTIPDSVTTIGEYAFYWCSSLTSVTIPDSVTSIGNSAFYSCTSLKKVYCNAAVPPSIGYSVFTGNESGRRIYVYEECVDLYKSAWSSYADSIYTNGQNCPNTTIIEYTTSDGNTITPGYYAFDATIVSNTYSNGKGVITFVGDVTEIGSSAFSDCSSLTSVTIPDSVTTIGDNAFAYCSSLTSVTIPDSVTTIGSLAFLSCDSLAEFNGKFAGDNGRILVVDGTLIAFAPAGLTEYTIPDSVTTIGYGAFACCESLTSVTIPDSVTTIGDNAFAYCSSLTSVTIGDSVTSIGYAAFSYCDNLAEFNGKFAEDNGRIWVVDGTLIAFAPARLTEYTIPDSVTTIGEYAFYGCSSLTSVTIGDSVTSIGEYAFHYCSSLTSVTIGDSVITIGLTAFGYCKKLTSVTIGNSVTTIGGNAFECCDSLTSVTIPDSVTTIGFCAFQACTSLTSITIPDSVISIGAYAFQTCTNLTSVYCKAIAPPVLEGDIFRYCKGYVIFVPTESVSAYKSANRWNSYASVIVGYDF